MITKFQPVQEAYFGKSKNLLEAESILNSIIKEFKVPFDKVGKRIIDAAKLNSSPKNKKLQELFQKEFGFGEMVLHWDGTNTVNAWSFARGIIKLINTDMPKLPVRSNDGRYYDGGHNYLCVVNVYAGLIDAGLTAEELMAVILHEIGHNFQCTPVTNIALFTDYIWIPIKMMEVSEAWKKARRAFKDIKDIWKIVEMLKEGKLQKSAKLIEEVKKNFSKSVMTLLTNIIRVEYYFSSMLGSVLRLIVREYIPEAMKKELEEIDKWILDNKNKVLARWKRYADQYQARKKAIESDTNRVAWDYLLSTVLDVAYYGLVGNIAAFEDLYNAQTGYAGEVFADSFATAYGYGGATVSLQAKFNQMRLKNPTLGLNKGNSNSVYNQYIFIMFSIVSASLDPHPMDQTRMKNQINKLERELESQEVPPKVKEAIRNDLAKAQEAYAAFIALPEDCRHLASVHNFYRINEMYFGGKLEIRDFFNRVLNLGMAEA